MQAFPSTLKESRKTGMPPLISESPNLLQACDGEETSAPATSGRQVGTQQTEGESSETLAGSSPPCPPGAHRGSTSTRGGPATPAGLLPAAAHVRLA